MTSRITKLLSSAAIVVAALSLCGFFYRKTQSVDMDQHLALTDELGEVQRLSTLLKQQTLAARFGLVNQYDALTGTEGELSASVERLHAKLGALPHASAATLARLQDLQRTELELRGDVERF